MKNQHIYLCVIQHEEGRELDAYSAHASMDSALKMARGYIDEINAMTDAPDYEQDQETHPTQWEQEIKEHEATFEAYDGGVRIEIMPINLYGIPQPQPALITSNNPERGFQGNITGADGLTPEKAFDRAARHIMSNTGLEAPYAVAYLDSVGGRHVADSTKYYMSAGKAFIHAFNAALPNNATLTRAVTKAYEHRG